MRKKSWLIIGFFLLVSVLLLTPTKGNFAGFKLIGESPLMAFSEKVNSDSLTIADFSDIPGVTQEYVDAYKIFLKAKAGDKQKPTYEDAANAFQKIANTTKNPELKLRSLYLVTYCDFLQLKIDEAYKNGMEVLKLSKSLLKGDKRVDFLNKIVSEIKKGKVSSFGDIKKVVETGSMGTEETKEITSFAKDLINLQEGANDYKKLKEKYEKRKTQTDKDMH